MFRRLVPFKDNSADNAATEIASNTSIEVHHIINTTTPAEIAPIVAAPVANVPIHTTTTSSLQSGNSNEADFSRLSLNKSTTENLFTSTWDDLVKFYSGQKVSSSPMSDSFLGGDSKADVIDILVNSTVQPSVSTVVVEPKLENRTENKSETTITTTKKAKDFFVDLASGSMKVVRRTVLNLFDRPSEQWAHAIRPDKDPFGAHLLMTNRNISRDRAEAAISLPIEGIPSSSSHGNITTRAVLRKILNRFGDKVHRWLFEEGSPRPLDTSVVRQVPKGRVIIKQLKLFSKAKNGRLFQRRKVDRRSRWEQLKLLGKSLLALDTLDDVHPDSQLAAMKELRQIEKQAVDGDLSQVANSSVQSKNFDRPAWIQAVVQRSERVIGPVASDLVKRVYGTMKTAGAGLLWDRDEARTMFQEAVIELPDSISEIPFEVSTTTRKRKFWLNIAARIRTMLSVMPFIAELRASPIQLVGKDDMVSIPKWSESIDSMETGSIEEEGDIRDRDVVEYQEIVILRPTNSDYNQSYFDQEEEDVEHDTINDSHEHKDVFKLPFSVNDFYTSSERIKMERQLKPSNNNATAAAAVASSWIPWPFQETGALEDSKEELFVDDAVKVSKAQQMQRIPSTPTEVPVPSKADFALLALRQAEVAISAALSIKSERDAKEFLQAIGPQSLIAGVVGTTLLTHKYDKVDAVKALCKLIRWHRPLTDVVGQRLDLMDILCDMMEAPLRGFKTFHSQQDRDRELRAQHEAVALVHRIVRSSEVAVEALRSHPRLRKILWNMVQSDPSAAQQNTLKLSKTLSATVNHTVVEPIPLSYEDTQISKSFFVKKKNSTTIVEYVNLKPSQMARVASWGIGGVPWKAKQPGQKGLRILSLDGGGTRGVLTIALLKELFKRLPNNLQPHDVFDIICGTSTGGIIAMLLGGQKRSIADTEFLYDEFVGKIFAQKSNFNFVRQQAFYDESKFEGILEQMCGDQLLLDSNQQDCPRVFCLSSKLNSNPPETKIWRNYNYAPNMKSRYPGSYRVNTKTAIRATTAAPTFFTPVQWEGQLFCDGAIVANNPTAIAFQESKVIYPGVPLELMVSIGTGFFLDRKENLQSLGLDALLNQLIASTTDTEDIHAMLNDFLPPEKYFRMNPALRSNMAIDEKDKNILSALKAFAKEKLDELETGPDAKHFKLMLKTLQGSK